MRVLSVLLVVVGLLLSAAGGTAAAVVGSDDVLETPTSRVDVGDAAAVTTAAGLFAFRGATMHLTASSPDGPVFVGRAHPVDVADWVGAAPRWVITRVDQDGVAGEGVPGGKDAKAPAAVADLDLWVDTDTGPKASTLAVRLDGSPTQVVVVPPEGSSTLDLRMGLAVPGAFATALALLATGLLMLVVGVLLVVRRRRRVRAGATPTAGDPAQTGAITSAPVDAPATTGTRLRVAAVALVVPTLLAGCSWVPEQATAWDPATVTRPAMTGADLDRMLAGYDERNNAAIATTSRTKDPKAWLAVDDELVLEGDQFSTLAAKVTKAKASTTTLAHTAKALYAPELHEYPLYAVAAVEVKRTDKAATGDAAKPATDIDVWTRRSVSEPWRMAATVGLPEKVTAPKALAPGAASTATAADRAAAVKAAERVRTYLGGGKATGLTVDRFLPDLRAGASIRNAKGVTHRLDARWANDAEDQASATGSVRTARTGDGTLAVVSLLARETFAVGSGSTLHWDEPYGTVLGQSGDRPSLSRDLGVTVVLLVPAKGAARVLSSEWTTLG
ncbi:hypothetical protein [Phycicoccus avicenniae]|uniref:hypothetical protein n=1 Tax=Phycicoccus avicenniae TaxID=2828860 RepID=UPI003D2CE9A9